MKSFASNGLHSTDLLFTSMGWKFFPGSGIDVYTCKAHTVAFTVIHSIANTKRLVNTYFLRKSVLTLYSIRNPLLNQSGTNEAAHSFNIAYYSHFNTAVAQDASGAQLADRHIRYTGYTCYYCHLPAGHEEIQEHEEEIQIEHSFYLSFRHYSCTFRKS